MIFRTKRGAYSGRLTGGDSAGQDKPAQFDMPGQNAAPIQDGLSGGFSLPGQSRGAGADDIQDKARRLFRTAYWGGIQLARTSRRSSICQDKARRLFRTAYRGDSAGQDKAAAQAAFRRR